MTKTRIKVEKVCDIETFIPQYRFMFIWFNFKEDEEDDYYVEFSNLRQAKHYLTRILLESKREDKTVTYIDFPENQ